MLTMPITSRNNWQMRRVRGESICGVLQYLSLRSV